jgi:hypothetical protein
MLELIPTNNYQTKITEDLKKSLSKNIWNDLLDYINNIKFIQNLIAPEEVRGYAKDLERWDNPNEDDPDERVLSTTGKIRVDLTKPHLLEDMDYFRSPAIHFKQYGRYTNLTPNKNPRSEYGKFWAEEYKKWKNGMTRPEDGEWIPGAYYFYLNYCQIFINEEDIADNSSKKKKRVKGTRRKEFPTTWLGDYLWFHYMQRARDNGEHCKLLKKRGCGFFGPNSEIVYTPEGKSTYGDINIGDYLIDNKGKPTKVLETYKQGIQPIYKITLMDGRTTKCGLSHLWTVWDQINKKYITVPTSYFLEKGLYYETGQGYKSYKFFIPYTLPVQHTKKELLIKPYILGYLLGDGSLSTTYIKVAIGDADAEETLKILNAELDNEYNLVEYKDGNRNYIIHDKIGGETVMYHGGINPTGCNRLKKAIHTLGLNVNCHNKFIPDIYKYSDIEDRIALLQGLMDSDGSIATTGKMEYSSSNFRLISDVAELCRSLGLHAKIGFGREACQREILGNVCNVQQEYRLYIAGNINIFRLPRKKERFRIKECRTKSAITDITFFNEEEATCFLVDNEDHLYLTKDYIPTHNSLKFGAISTHSMYVNPGLPNFHLASDKMYLEGEKGIFSKVVDTLDWVGSNTPFPKQRIVDRALEKQLGFKKAGDSEIKGIKSSVFGISLNDNPDKARGVRGPIIQYEEDGIFPDIIDAWMVNLEATEEGGIVFGTMVAGGCVCAGTKVWTNDGKFINIEDLVQSEGILGFNIEQGLISKESITYMQRPSKKSCYKIITNTGRYLECSEDHPILWSRQNFGSNPRSKVNKNLRIFKKRTIFKPVKEIQIGDQLAIAEEVNVFGELDMWEPRVIGWLIGDGTYGINHSPRLANCEIEINDYVKEKFDAKVTRGHITKEGKVYEEIRLKGICCKLRELGIYGQTKLNKRLPVNIHSYKLDDICDLIGGLFDTNGYVSKTRISISSAGCELLAELKLLLQKLGIHGNINYKKPNINNPRSKNGHFELEIASKQSILNFLQYITLYPAHKKVALNNLYKSLKTNKGRVSTSIKGIVFERVTNIEYIGIKDVYNLTANTTNTYIANGIITHNTGGTDGNNFAGSEKLFRHPEIYHIYGLPNIFDKGADGKVNCGFFWGAYLNRARCYNKETGEPDIIAALIEVLDDRETIKKGATDSKPIDKRKAEQPITPAEAMLKISGTVFPIGELKDYLADIEIDVNKFTQANLVGEFIFNEDKSVKFSLNNGLYPIRNFPLEGSNTAGAVEIFMLPKDNNHFRYIIGVDPIDNDYIANGSLGSAFVFDVLLDVIVAEYTGRPNKADDFYKTVLQLSKFYNNAEINYESNLKGLFGYFDKQNCLHLLMETPKILRDRELVQTSGSGNRNVGTPNNKGIISYANKLFADWLMSEHNTSLDGEATTILKLRTVKSVPLLKEAVAWDGEINTDRISAIDMVMIAREDKQKYIEGYGNTDRKKRAIYEDPLFKKYDKLKAISKK